MLGWGIEFPIYLHVYRKEGASVYTVYMYMYMLYTCMYMNLGVHVRRSCLPLPCLND